MRALRHGNTVRARKVFRRMIPFGTGTGSRHSVLVRSTYTRPKGPWIDADNGCFWRDGAEDTNDVKQGGAMLLVGDLLKLVRQARDEDSRGWNASEYFLHKEDGTPYAKTGIPTSTSHKMIEDAGLGRKFLPRNMKDVFVDVAETEGLTRAQMASILATHERTLERRYGADRNLAAQRDPLMKMNRKTKTKKAQAAILAHRASVELARTMPRPKKPRARVKPTGKPVGRPRKTTRA